MHFLTLYRVYKALMNTFSGLQCLLGCGARLTHGPPHPSRAARPPPRALGAAGRRRLVQQRLLVDDRGEPVHGGHRLLELAAPAELVQGALAKKKKAKAAKKPAAVRKKKRARDADEEPASPKRARDEGDDWDFDNGVDE